MHKFNNLWNVLLIFLMLWFNVVSTTSALVVTDVVHDGTGRRALYGEKTVDES